MRRRLAGPKAPDNRRATVCVVVHCGFGAPDVRAREFDWLRLNLGTVSTHLQQRNGTNVGDLMTCMERRQPPKTVPNGRARTSRVFSARVRWQRQITDTRWISCRTRQPVPASAPAVFGSRTFP
jgi:hypothetical protein